MQRQGASCKQGKDKIKEVNAVRDDSKGVEQKVNGDQQIDEIGENDKYRQGPNQKQGVHKSQETCEIEDDSEYTVEIYHKRDGVGVDQKQGMDQEQGLVVKQQLHLICDQQGMSKEKREEEAQKFVSVKDELQCGQGIYEEKVLDDYQLESDGNDQEKSQSEDQEEGYLYT